jgi:hypothetical protein
MAEERSKPGCEGPGVSQREELSMELQVALAEGCLQSSDELPAKDAAEHSGRKKEGRLRGDPAGSIWSEPACSQHAVDMRVMLQALIPGVEHAEEADLRTKVPGIASDLKQGLSAGVEQQVIE